MEPLSNPKTQGTGVDVVDDFQAAAILNRFILAGSPVCNKIIDLDYTLRYMSDAGIKQLKIPDIHPYYGQTFPPKFYPEAMRAPLIASLKLAMEGQVSSVECPVHDIEGNEVWYHTTYSPAFDDDGKVMFVIGSSVDITERKQSEQKLNAALKMASNAEKAANLGSWSWTLKSNRVNWSENMCRLHGIEPTEYEATFEYASRFQHPDDRNHISHQIELMLTQKKSQPYEYRIVTPAGQVKWVEGTNQLFSDENDEIIEVVGTVQEVTERKATETALAESQERFELAMSATKDGLYDWDLINNKIFYSARWKKMLGYEAHELPNDFSIWEKLTQPADVKRSWKMQTELIHRQRDRFELEFKMKHKDGRWVDILSRAEAYFDETGKAVRIVGTHVDITERKHAAEKLRAAEQNLKRTFDLSPSIIAKANVDSGYFIEASPAVTRLLGYSVEEFTSRSLMEFIHPDDRQKTADEVAKQLEGKEVAFFENRYLCKDGSIKWLAWQGTVPDEDGIVTAIGTDVTSRKRAEQELQEAHNNLEIRVEKRTKELQKKMDENKDLFDMMVGREVRMGELKQVIEKLRKQLIDMGVKPVVGKK